MNEQPAQGDSPSQRILNPDGTTNWAVLFEDPTQGILVAVNATASVNQLRAVMSNVALLLFKRKRDAEPRAEFVAKIERMLEGAETDGFDAVRERIAAMLRAEKIFRIEKAEQHARNKRTTQSIERRRDGTHQKFMDMVLGNPFILMGAVALVLGLLGLVVVAVILPSDKPAPKETAETQAEAPEPEAPLGPVQLKKHPVVAPPPETLKMLALKPILSEVLVKGARRRLSMVPLIEVREDDGLGDICALSPWIIEGVLLRMGAANDAKRNADDALIAEVAARVSKDINARPGDVKIRSLKLVDIRKLPRKIVLAANRGCETVTMEQTP